MFSRARRIPAFLVCSLLGMFVIVPFETQGQEKPHHPVVPGYERFLNVESITDGDRGELLINELNCKSCHKDLQTSWTVASRRAPILTKVGNRVRPKYIQQFLSDPHGTKPGTTMPDLLAGRPIEQRNRIANRLAHFLALTGSTSDTPPFPGLVANGEKLFHSIGCVACHDPQKTDEHYETSVPLGDLAAKYTIGGLGEFLRDPLKIRPSGRMPHLSLTGKEAQEIASYLLKDIKVKSNINVAVYHGSWDKLPDFASLKPVSTGSVPAITAGAAGRNDNFGLVFTGYWQVDRPGKYSFNLASDDGSRLVIDGKRIIDNDGIHGVKAVQGSTELGPGVHEVRIEFFEKGGGEEVRCEVSGPGLGKQPIGGLLRATREPPMDKDRFVVDRSRAEEGRKYFISLGCANCHELNVNGERLKPTLDLAGKKTRAELAGCLTGKGNVPQFGLNEQQANAILAAMKDGRRQAPDRKNRIHQKLTTFNCYSCHERDLVGGVLDRTGESDEIYGREKWFTSNQPEMGDEGRLPPFLNGVGAKLNERWLNEVVDNGAKERPYMMTRMPRFGKDNLGSLVDDLRAVDQLKEVITIEFEQSIRKIKEIGKAFAGTSEKENGLSCIKCHTFGKYQATGIQAISLTSMTKRLNRDWFIQYMLKPSRYRPGTRMPESWPGGKSFFPDVLDGDPHKQIAAIWEFLSDGEKAAKPKGLIQAKMQLVATRAPRIYRNFIEGAGPRAIGVGYPEELNLAFDANNNRLAMIWTGAFIDASRHWTGRGQGFQPPLGDNVLKLPEGVPFALPDRAAKQWPVGSGKELGIRFKGYRFNDQRQPVFNYRLDDIQIRDFPAPHRSDEAWTLLRSFELQSNGKSPEVWYRAAIGNRITRNDDGTYSIDQDYRTRIETDGDTVIRNSNGKQELIVRLGLSGGKATFSQEYIW